MYIYIFIAMIQVLCVILPGFCDNITIYFTTDPKFCTELKHFNHENPGMQGGNDLKTQLAARYGSGCRVKSCVS